MNDRLRFHGEFVPPHRRSDNCSWACNNVPPGTNLDELWDDYEAGLSEETTKRVMAAKRQRINDLAWKVIQGKSS